MSLSLLIALAVVVASCQLVLNLDRPEGNERPPPDAAAVEAAATPIDPCNHAQPPPQKGDDDTETQNNYWLALDSIIPPLQVDAGGVPLLGFDLDNACTCQKDLYDGAPSCITPAKTSPTVCDFDGGIDDSFGEAVGRFAPDVFDIELTRRVLEQIQYGERTQLIYLSKYNGKANDSDVGVAFIGSGGLYTNLGCDGQPRGDGGYVLFDPDAGKPGPQYAPLWDGCDRWTPKLGQAYGEYPKRATPVIAAYVVDHVLVAPVKSFALEVFGAATQAQNGFIVLRLTPEGRGFRADGIMSVRLSFSDLVSVVGRATIGPAREPLCQTTYWPIVSQSLCEARDVMESIARDHTGATCDAVSATFGFSARPAEVANGEFDNVPPQVTNCDASVECVVDDGGGR